MATVQKGEKCVWGTTEPGFQKGGIATSVSFQDQAQTDVLEDKEGAQVGLVIYDQRYTATITVVCKQGETLPEVGETINVKGQKFVVTDVKTDWQNKGKKQFTVTAVGGKNQKL